VRESLSGPGDSSQQSDGIGQRGRQPGCAARGIAVGTFAGVGCLSLPYYLLLAPHQSPTRQLVIGGATYALGFGTTLLHGVMLKRTVGHLRHFLHSLVVSILFFPTFLASICIAAALSHLAGWHLDLRGEYLFGLVFYAVLPSAVSVAVFGLRRRLRRGRRTTAQG
jgi:hypothetical protein